MKFKKAPELLAPAGDLEKLKIALHYGADAVYCGGKAYGLRSGAGNLDDEELQLGIDYAHKLGKKVYVTVNILPRNKDLDGLPSYIEQLKIIGVDALIIADPGVLEIVREIAPEIPVLLSTQANALNRRSVKFWQKQGVKRVILARELTKTEIKEIKDYNNNIELETFIHGAMCMGYSGRCLLSMYLAGRDANLGDCAHPCRWKYYVVEEKRPGEYYQLEEDKEGTHIFNSKDLCLLPHIPELIDMNIDSLKIEGRMKGIHYVATVTRVYRQALDIYCNEPDRYEELMPYWREELEKVSHRPYTTGFFSGSLEADAHVYDSSGYTSQSKIVGLVKYYDSRKGLALLEQRNHFAKGDLLEVFGTVTERHSYGLVEMYDSEMQPIVNAPHPQQEVWINAPRELSPLDIVRKIKTIE